jgi:hypothetical protein
VLPRPESTASLSHFGVNARYLADAEKALGFLGAGGGIRVKFTGDLDPYVVEPNAPTCAKVSVIVMPLRIDAPAKVAAPPSSAMTYDVAAE